VGPRAVLDAVVKRKIPSLRRESTLDFFKPKNNATLGDFSNRNKFDVI
jgi:hypothetical protein